MGGGANVCLDSLCRIENRFEQQAELESLSVEERIVPGDAPRERAYRRGFSLE